MSGEFRPYTLIAELSYRCPLRCSYCSNPIDWASRRNELDTETWLRVFRDAEDLGVVQLNLTGGEPLVRSDLEALIAGARKLDLYTNLITSAIPLSRERLESFRAAGLDNVQISVQDVTADASDRIAGRRSFDRKLEVGGWVKELGMPLTLNIVLHRGNLDRVAEVVALAERMNVDRLELANTQYLGWALVNRRALLPLAISSIARAPSPRRRENACAAAWKSCSSPPIIIPIIRRAAWTAGGGALSSSARTGSRCPVMRRTRCRDSFSRTSATAASPRSGRTRQASTPSAARLGCRSLAEVATDAASISAAAAAKPIT